MQSTTRLERNSHITQRYDSEHLTTTIRLTLMMTFPQVVKTSIVTTDKIPSQDYTHPDDQTTLLQ